jgi:trehalose 6-phosphate phosphatase
MHVSSSLLLRTDRRPLSVQREKLALFLDLDGTLAPLAETPDAVLPDRARSDLVSGLVKSLGGRVAILSGRTISEVDRILDAAVPAVAGVHGLERRDGSGNLKQFDPSPALAGARTVLLEFAASRPGLLVEDKGMAVAIHYRKRPSDEDDVVGVAERLAAASGMRLQPGHMVVELVTPGPTKGDALAAFMAEAPFAGSVPFAVGDDQTDEAAFRRADDLGGAGVLVGPERPTAAAYRLAGIDETLGWLAGLMKTERNMTQ